MARQLARQCLIGQLSGAPLAEPPHDRVACAEAAQCALLWRRDLMHHRGRVMDGLRDPVCSDSGSGSGLR